ncbi:MAG TPA: cytochrome c-type biogenesis protein CcmH [Actinomycetota bacterium]|nr:cytochrome c-type biogenesis protein CcmH [Actinomycetota bacterium]
MRRVLVVACCLALWPTVAAAAPEDVANRISNEIMSPYCPGVTLHDCPSRQADELREQIEGWAAQGWDDDRIMAELEDQFGEGIRATPPSEGGGILWWILPGIVAVLGAFFAGALARRWSRARAEEIEEERLEARREQAALSAEQRQRLSAELADHEARMMGVQPKGRA